MSRVTSDPGIARRVARLENDRDALYELIDEFRAESRARFHRLEGTLAEVTQQHSRRFDRLEGTLAEVLRRLPESL
ncbi:hypothetical protein JCM18899A_14960 [Nocardioides sp. AN3]